MDKEGLDGIIDSVMTKFGIQPKDSLIEKSIDRSDRNCENCYLIGDCILYKIYLSLYSKPIYREINTVCPFWKSKIIVKNGLEELR